MGQAIGQMLTMAVGVAVSPLPIIAVVLLVVSPNGRLKGAAFALACCVSTAIVGGALVAIGVGAGATDDSGPTTRATVLRRRSSPPTRLEIGQRRCSDT